MSSKSQLCTILRINTAKPKRTQASRVALEASGAATGVFVTCGAPVVIGDPLDRFRIIHIAAHGVASAMFPNRAALVLGEDPQRHDDSLLQVRDIQQLHLNTALVTLSACDTGAGQLEGEEGIENIERAFLFAGARSVLASLWTASDVYTTDLMESFYRNLAAGQDEGDALRNSKLELLKRFRAQATPFYWAGFTVVGDTFTRVGTGSN